MITRIKTLVQEKRQELVRFFKFCIVGTIGTVIDFGLFNLLHNVLGLHAIIANLLSTSAAVVNNYTWSRFWVYPETKNQQGGTKFFRFVIVSIIAVVLNTTILHVTDVWIFGQQGLLGELVAPLAQWANTEHGVLSSNAAKVISTGIVLFWNFFANRFWTFRDVDQVQTAPAKPTDDGSNAFAK